MAILNIIITDLFIGKSLISLRQLNEAFVEGLNGLVLGGVRLDLVGMVDERKSLIMSGDSFLIGALAKR
jgi:hypothetical protein